MSVTSQNRLPASTAIYFTYRDNNRSFESVALWNMDTATITGDGSPEEVLDETASHCIALLEEVLSDNG